MFFNILFFFFSPFLKFIFSRPQKFLLLFLCIPIIIEAQPKKPVLVIYTYDSFIADWGAGPGIKKSFEKNCDCQLKWVSFKDGVSLLNRLKMVNTNNSADIVLGLDNHLLVAAEKTGLFLESKLDTSRMNLPKNWESKIFIPYDFGYFSFVYNKNKLKDPPKSLYELLNSNNSWRLIYQDPRASTPGLGLLFFIQKVYGAEAPKMWTKLAAKTVTVTKNWSEAYGLFLKGESDFVWSYTTSPAYHIIEEKNHQYASINFREGHYLQIETVAQLATSKHPKLAQRFMEFVLTPEFQKHIATGNWMYPVIKITLPKGFDELIQPQKVLLYSSKETAENRNKWINLWQTAVSL
ncbi:thiamine ABC transporter substrate binding subunit [Candidatus Williamhamiltonella defendens]|uniref:thiamine ABC transporter substrate binding subunit n=1 Tax=Candidatus Williamhamiltonella defendens TaxID=138072 RepID=UPI00130E0611|nr:thiamine ABC transporter substrate binding subunit [Candidatus Hamiltonella defensa]